MKTLAWPGRAGQPSPPVGLVARTRFVFVFVFVFVRDSALGDPLAGWTRPQGVAT